MPIVDVSLVLGHSGEAPPDTANRIADQLGSALELEPGHLWVRLRIIPANCYAENHSSLGPAQWPVFVTMLHARPPTGVSLCAEAARVAAAIAAATGRDVARVHVEYAPPGAGRIAFGGQLAPSTTDQASYFILYVADQRRSRDFYATALACQPRLDVPGMTEFALPGDGVLGLMPEAGIKSLLGAGLPDPARARGGARAELYLVVDRPAEFHLRALAAGATELSSLQPRNWGHAAAYSLDPDGHVLAFAAPMP